MRTLLGLVDARVAIVTMCLASASQSRAGWMYSIDSTLNGLVRINDQTGEVLPIAPLSESLPAVSNALALYQGMLYAIRFDKDIETRLLIIDPQDGTVTSNVEVTWNGQPVGFAEGLINDGAGLIISFHTDAAGDFDSNAKGELAADGIISNAISLGADVDMDQTAYDPISGNVYNVDFIPVTQRVELNSVPHPSGAYTYLGLLFEGANYTTFSTEFAQGTLVGVSSSTLYHINPATLAIEAEIPLSRASGFHGLAQSDLDWDCPADLNNSGAVDGADLGLLLSVWGTCAVCGQDLNGSGAIDGADLGLLLAAWGACP
ncbi:MAG: hypothetical protein ACYTF7_11040 [Planctomycetota bacterium]|jgi:hypothetical protein